MSVIFNKIPINKEYGKAIFDIYYVVENSKSKVMGAFYDLSDDFRDQIKDLISRMATNRGFKSPKIKYNLKEYNYGEIRPMPHRFFFFQKCGSNYIFFDYILKKEDSLDAKIYKDINKRKEKYEEEFRKFIERN